MEPLSGHFVEATVPENLQTSEKPHERPLKDCPNNFTKMGCLIFGLKNVEINES